MSNRKRGPRQDILVYQVKAWDGGLVSNSKANLRYISVTLPWLSIFRDEPGIQPFKHCRSAEKGLHLNPLRYFGLVCPRHPELNGERLISNKHCIRCGNERSRAARRRKGNGTTRFTGKVCERHPHLDGQRSAANGRCPACHCDAVASRRRAKKAEQASGPPRDKRQSKPPA